MRSISARLCSFGFLAVCSLPAALLAFIHHGCQSGEAFSQIDIILLSSAESRSVASLHNTLLHYGFYIDCGERVARSRKDRGGRGENGKDNWQQEKRMRCNTQKELKGKDKRRRVHGDKRQRKNKTEITPSKAILSVSGNPGRFPATAYSSQYLITAWVFQVMTPRSPLCSILARIWLTASPSDPPLAPHTCTHALTLQIKCPTLFHLGCCGSI